jgi:hypothetical protein
MLSKETTNTNFIVLGLTRSGIESTIYHTRDEHANHYITDEPTIYHTQDEHANNYTTNANNLRVFVSEKSRVPEQESQIRLWSPIPKG